MRRRWKVAGERAVGCTTVRALFTYWEFFVVDKPRMLTEKAARQLSNTTKTPPQWRGATPRWLVQMIPWTPVEAGTYRVNQALDDDFAAKCSPAQGEALPVAFSDYDAQPRE
jgi:hypothetical protein